MIGLRAPNFRLHVFDFRDGYLPYEGGQVKDALRKVAVTLDPDLIFTHYRHDAHQDHRIASEITWNLFRNHLILEYEIPKYDGDLGQPNIYVPLSEQIADKKIELLLRSFGSQSEKHWFTEETFRSILRLRGVEAGSGAIYSEAFHSRKILFAGAAT
jgi:LmbE family N-acetylglucosaminyl deacetylase